MVSGDGIVWLASYPKSGNTWLRLLFANLLSGADEPADINRFRLNLLSPSARGDVEDLTLIDTGLLTRDEVDQLRPLVNKAIAAEVTGRWYIKVHDAYRINSDGEALLGRGTARAALLIVRDPRDVAVSLAFHHGCSLDEAIHILNSNRFMGWDRRRLTTHLPQALLDWSGHTTSWLAQREVPTHVLRYEDLWANPVETFGAAVAFLDLEVPPGTVERAVRFAGFTEVQRQERRNGFWERLAQSTAPFFRSGRAGAWAGILSRAQQDAIVGRHQTVMAQFGYL